MYWEETNIKKIIIGLIVCCICFLSIRKTFALDLIFQDVNYFSGTTSAAIGEVTSLGTVNANHIYRIDNALCTITKTLNLGIGTSSATVILVRTDDSTGVTHSNHPFLISGLAGTVSLYVASSYASTYYIITYTDFTTQ